MKDTARAAFDQDLERAKEEKREARRLVRAYKVKAAELAAILDRLEEIGRFAKRLRVKASHLGRADEVPRNWKPVGLKPGRPPLYQSGECRLAGTSGSPIWPRPHLGPRPRRLNESYQ